MVLINILDYSPIFEGSNARQALLHTKELAQQADQLGYNRYWVAEHHHVFSVAGSTPELLMMQLAAATENIRIGSGGVMLPHYSPYKVAENFRMLEAFHPNRIDLGIGRSPGFPNVNKAMNETKTKRIPYDQQIKDLYKYFTDNTNDDHRFQDLIATPVIDTIPEMWLLGSGSRSARIAAETRSAYAFAHFAPNTRVNSNKQVVSEYRRHFKPSVLFDKPKVMIAVFAIIADTKEEAEVIAKAFDLWLLFIESNNQPPYMPSIQTAKNRGHSIIEEEKITQNRSRVILGDAEQVKHGIEQLAEQYEADEITIIPQFFGEKNRIKALELLAKAWGLDRNRN